MYSSSTKLIIDQNLNKNLILFTHMYIVNWFCYIGDELISPYVDDKKKYVTHFFTYECTSIFTYFTHYCKVYLLKNIY